MLDVAGEIVYDEKKRVRYHYVLIDFLLTPIQDEVILNDESSAYQWFEPENVRELETTANTKKMVRRYLELSALRSADHELR